MTPCHWPHSETDPFLDSNDPGQRSLQTMPFDASSVIYVQDVGNSGDRPANSYWWANTQTGEMRPITDGQFLAWSPDRKRFCTASVRDFAAYGHSKSLYVSSLDIGSAVRHEQTQTIVGGLVWVTGADWRGGAGRKGVTP